jgi:hypothetical protein
LAEAAAAGANDASVKVLTLPVAVVEVRATEVPVAAPMFGVVSVGDVEKTKLVDVVPVVPAAVNPVILLKQVIEAELQLVPPFATGKIPVTPVVKGRPVALVSTPALGVPKLGVTKVGLVAKTATVPEPVVVISPTNPPLLYSIRPVVPDVMEVVPIVIPLAPQPVQVPVTVKLPSNHASPSTSKSSVINRSSAAPREWPVVPVPKRE